MRNLIESYLNLLHLSITDQLTGLYNRTYLDIKASKEIKNGKLQPKDYYSTFIGYRSL